MECRSREAVEAIIGETVAQVVREVDSIGMGTTTLRFVAGVAVYDPPRGTDGAAMRDVLREAIWIFERRRREGGVETRRAGRAGARRRRRVG